MGWSFRKSINFGPVRVNVSKSGIGYSVGGGGFRTGVRAGGRRYTRVTIPGTGISYQPTGKSSAGCMIWFVMFAGFFAFFY
ncbi:MAG: DUF4236 domain-containing protein [Planctomycetes bacterium]|nr:DUF4236 domain-containing protein [Planctomycetota bacterium]